jgi:hypothetical protein
MISLVALACLSLTGPPGPDAVTLRASLPDAALEVGTTVTIELQLEIADAWSSTDAGIPKPILQIEVPPSARLAGKVLTGRRELARNEFLRAPFERMIAPGQSTVELELTGAPAPGETFGLNVIGYLATADGEDAWFVRRRVELPLRGSTVQLQELLAKGDVIVTTYRAFW